MTRRTIIVVSLLVLVVAAVVGGVVFRLSRFVEGPEIAHAPAPAPASAVAPAQAHIKARIYSAAPDGEHLVPVERDVPMGESTGEQARRIVEAQLAPAAPPLVSPIPPGTRLRAFFVTGDGRAVVDLSGEARTAHPGGLTSEMLTVYAIVNVLLVNLPAITSVQILVDGQPAESLAGHVNLRQALHRNLDLVAEPAPAPAVRPAPPAAEAPAPPAEPSPAGTHGRVD